MDLTLNERTKNDQSTLHKRIANRLGALIVQGKLHPGSTLPNEAELGAEFGVSRTALREATKVLASKGLLEVRRKTGTRVRPHGDWNVLDPAVLEWLFAGPGLPPRLTDLLEVRLLIEPAAAAMAAARATGEDHEEIRAAFAAMQSAAKQPELSVEADLQFHLAVLNASHNAFMLPFGALIQAALRTSFRLTSSDPVAYRRTLTLHRSVLEAIVGSRATDAETAMHRILRQTAVEIARPAKPRPGKSVGGRKKATESKRERKTAGKPVRG